MPNVDEMVLRLDRVARRLEVLARERRQIDGAAAAEELRWIIGRLRGLRAAEIAAREAERHQPTLADAWSDVVQE
jgi:hypothetical protein